MNRFVLLGAGFLIGAATAFLGLLAALGAGIDDDHHVMERMR